MVQQPVQSGERSPQVRSTAPGPGLALEEPVSGTAVEDGLLGSVTRLPADPALTSAVMSVRARVVVAAVVGATLLLALVGLALDLRTLRGITVALFLLVELGTAPVLLLKPMAPTWFALYAVTTSLVTTVIVGFVMSVLHVWHPMAMFGVVAVVVVALLALAVSRDLRHRSG